MNKDPFVPADEAGLSTLVSISGADRLNDWMFGEIRPYMSGRILEIGSGIGNISSRLVGHGLSLTLSDYSDHYCQVLRARFSTEPLVREVVRIDLGDEGFAVRHARLLGAFDTVFALNVVEHIEDDLLAVANCCQLLAAGGRLVLLMPAYNFLFNRFDRELGHYRRYSRRSMARLLSTELEVQRVWHFNLASVGAWFLFGTVLRRRAITEGQMKVYNKLVGLFRLVDKMSFGRAGLSVLGVGKKK